LVAAHPSVAAHARRLGAALLANGDHEAAIVPLQRAVALEPENARGHNNLGEAYLAQGATELAIDCYRRAISCEPSRAPAYNNLGRALLRSERCAEAVESLERAIALAPALIAAHLNLGGALSSLGRFAEALAAFERALRLDPDHVPALVARARALRTLGQPAEARRCLERGLELNPDDVNLLSELGALFGSESEYLAAAPIFERLATMVPELPYVKGYRLFLKLLCSNWNDYDVDNARLRDAVELGRRACTPFQSLLFFDSPAALRRCAETFVGDRYPEVPARAPQAGRSHGPAGRIRVAYLSGDFGDHPVSHLLAGVLESHDKSQFDVWALGWGQQRQGPMRTRIEQAVSRFIDISRLDDAEVARLLRDSHVDIAVDLMGHTRDQRTGIFALRAAPIQSQLPGVSRVHGCVVHGLPDCRCSGGSRGNGERLRRADREAPALLSAVRGSTRDRCSPAFAGSRGIAGTRFRVLRVQ
jgi:protein O-GlcNAc transferase